MEFDQFADADWPTLARYLSGECSPAEANAVEAWIDSLPGRRAEVELLRLGWHNAALLPSATRAEHVLRNVARRAGIEVGRGGSVQRPFAARMIGALSKSRRMPAMVATAAVAAGVVLAVVTWGGVAHRQPVGVEAPVHVFATRPAEKTAIRLDDGTRITLGAASRLLVPADYGRGTRTVSLDGEAYFQVRYDSGRPFRVHTAALVTEDLGTSFLIQARDRVASVLVLEGSVAVRSDTSGNGRGLAVTRGQLARLAGPGLVSVTDVADADAMVRWLEGQLEFRKTLLSEVQGAFERWYGVRIELPKASLAAVPVTASFTGQSTDQALRTLAQLLALDYERRGSTARFFVPSDRVDRDTP